MNQDSASKKENILQLLQCHLKEKEQILQQLKVKEKIINDLEEELKNMTQSDIVVEPTTKDQKLAGNDLKKLFEYTSLDHYSIARYSRQIILPELGSSGQIKLRNSSILIVGCGGLGCPAAIYLAGAGIGKLGLVDYDVVEVSNLHRQILHTEGRIGMSKSESIKMAVLNLNKKMLCETFNVAVNSTTITDIIKDYDIILDCTDNVATRYLLNDASVLNSKPLVSGSALKFQGQLTVYNYQNGPCYRCIFPTPPPPDTVTNCSDGGVLGAVPGVLGTLQALEAIKIAVQMGNPLNHSMLVFDALTTSFRSFKIRSRDPNCVICGINPSQKDLIDYEEFCGAAATDKDKDLNLIPNSLRISVADYKTILEHKRPHLLVDVRDPVELEICKFTHCINVPYKNLHKEEVLNNLKENLKNKKTNQIICLCHRGNDSQKAAIFLKDVFKDRNDLIITDIVGGLYAWAKKIDNSVPLY